MPLCDQCLEWAPTTRRELQIRKSNTAEPGQEGNGPMPCQNCGGIDYLYTCARIQPHRYPGNWLSRLYWRLRGAI